jgi:hypothetical protein
MSHVGKLGEGRWARNKQLAAYAGVSLMTLWRWKNDPKLGFPPAAVINGIEHNNLDAFDKWMWSRAVHRNNGHEAQAAESSAAPTTAAGDRLQRPQPRPSRSSAAKPMLGPIRTSGCDGTEC